MSSYDIIQSNFQAGELSPLFSGRSTSNLYAYGMKKAQNVLPMKAGGARRRPGTYFAGKIARGSTRSDEDPHRFFVVDDVIYDFSTDYLRISSVAYHPNESFDYVTTINLSGTYSLYCDPYKVQMTKIGTHLLFLIDGEVCEVYYSESEEEESGWIVNQLVFTGLSNTYINSITSKDGRLVVFRYGTMYLSASPDYSLDDPYRFRNFTLGSDSGSAISITNETFTRIDTWIFAHNRLMAGSWDGVLSSTGTGIDATSFYMSKILSVPTAFIKPKALGSNIVMVSGSQRSLLLLTYSNETQSYSANDITENAQHLFTSGIKDFEILSMAEDIIWVLLENGELLSCSITQAGELGTYGWAKHTFGTRTVTEIAAIKSKGKRDRLLIAYYPGADGTYKYVDFLDVPGMFYQSDYSLDSAVEYRFSTSTREIDYYTEPDMVDHEHLVALIDGKLYQVEMGAGGDIILPVAGSNIVIGTTYRSVFGFLNKEIPSNGDSSIYNKRRLKKATVSVYQSQGGKIGLQYADESKMLKMLTSKYGELKYGEQPHIVDEILEMEINSPNVRSAELYITTEEPTPLNILSVKEKIEILET